VVTEKIDVFQIGSAMLYVGASTNVPRPDFLTVIIVAPRTMLKISDTAQHTSSFSIIMGP
jgi:hypothetical protein